jgi:hypothetical protein
MVPRIRLLNGLHAAAVYRRYSLVGVTTVAAYEQPHGRRKARDFTGKFDINGADVP